MEFLFGCFLGSLITYWVMSNPSKVKEISNIIKEEVKTYRKAVNADRIERTITAVGEQFLTIYKLDGSIEQYQGSGQVGESYPEGIIPTFDIKALLIHIEKMMNERRVNIIYGRNQWTHIDETNSKL